MNTYDNTTSEAVAVCANCHQTFERRRKDQIYCGARCRKASHQKADRKLHPKNSKCSPTTWRKNMEFFDTAARLAEELYSKPPSERLGHMKDLVDRARAGNTKLREILTNPILLKPDRKSKRLFHRRCPVSYYTIAQAADRYCRKFWKSGVVKVVRGIAPEPPTGEVLAPTKRRHH